MANSTKLTVDVREKIVQAVGLGTTYELAAAYAGVNPETLRQWRRRGERERSGPYRELVESLAQSEGRAAVGWLAKIEKAASDGIWQAAAWKLERRYPELYGRQVHDHYRREVVERIAREEGVDPARLYDLAFERERRRSG